MEPFTTGAIAIGTVIVTIALEKTGKTLWDKTGQFLATFKKHSDHTVVSIEKAPSQPLDYGKAVLEVAVAALVQSVITQIQSFVLSVVFN